MINPELRHIPGKQNVVADILSRARYGDDMVEEGSVIGMRVEVEKVGFKKHLYSDEMLIIGRYLETLEKDEAWDREEFSRIWKKAYKFALKEGYLWRRPKKAGEAILWVVGTEEEKQRKLSESHDAETAGHHGVQATYEKARGLYWWAGMYVDIRAYVETCQVCQYYSKIQHRDELRPTHPLSLHFQLGLDIVHMPRGARGAKYLILAREDLSSYVEGRALPPSRGKEILH
ncbi:unnamed protein product [Calypogeia fissa]